jgi:hypothetical protein
MELTNLKGYGKVALDLFNLFCYNGLPFRGNLSVFQKKFKGFAHRVYLPDNI